MMLPINLFNLSNIRCITVALTAITGTGLAIFKSEKEKLNTENDENEKDKIIEDLAERYNALVEMINSGEIDESLMEDINIPEDFDDYDDEDDDEDTYEEEDDDDDDDEEDDTLEIRFDYEDEDDNPELCYYPGKYVRLAQDLQNMLKNIFTDIEKHYEELGEEIPDFEIEAIDACNHAVGMMGTAYQMGFVDGVGEYIKMLKGGAKDVRKIGYIEFSNNADLQTAIVEFVKMSNDFINAMNEDDPEDETVDADNFVVPVHHKKGDNS